MSAKTLKQVFDEHFAHVKFDRSFVNKIYQYQLGYVNRNSDHLDFLGSNLLGVHVLRFKDSDVILFFDSVVDVDYDALTQSIRQLDTINHEYKVASDVFNLTLFYVMHRCLTSEAMNPLHRERSAYDAALVYFYRCIAALISAWFKYPTDPKIAQAAYANLSNKHLIKKLGSWNKLIDYRTKDLVTKSGLHFKTITFFTEDDEILKAIKDAQGRIRDIIKNYCAEFYKVHGQGDSIGVTSSTFLDAEGEETVKEKTRSVESVVTYLKNIVLDKNSFIKDDLISVIVKINSNTSFRMVKSTLGWFSDNYGSSKHFKQIDEFMSLVIVQSLYMIEHNMEVKHLRDYPHILVNLKNLYLSTRTTDPDVEKIRDMGYDLIKSSNPGISKSLILSTRTSIILYLTLRALAGNVKT